MNKEIYYEPTCGDYGKKEKEECCVCINIYPRCEEKEYWDKDDEKCSEKPYDDEEYSEKEYSDKKPDDKKEKKDKCCVCINVYCECKVHKYKERPQ